MNLHTLSPNPGAKRRVKRLGCGESSGHGKTACKGNKGQKARSGSGTRVGFEGGQMPLHRRLPKRGFNNYDFRDVPGVINVGDLDDAFEAGAVIDETCLREVGLLNNRCDFVKVLGTGEVTKSFTLVVDRVSASAREKIEKAGGSIQSPA
ncbi:MAG: 50S ribosomal protein L15 [Akkermansiaceae bacterium]|nr:50S ribosomal protein L15 [Akkermansiaceae bacterium]MCF7730894.1 50S ribosomal protein L15 [Akkermansiaceae bacterium]